MGVGGADGLEVSWLGVLLFFRHGWLFEFEMVMDERSGSGEGRCERDDEEVGVEEGERRCE